MDIAVRSHGFKELERLLFRTITKLDDLAILRGFRQGSYLSKIELRTLTQEEMFALYRSRADEILMRTKQEWSALDALDGWQMMAQNTKEWSIRGRLRAEGLEGLPGGGTKSGPFRFRPRLGYNPNQPLQRGINGGYLDRFGNEWVQGPYHGDPSKGFAHEWDVWLTPRGAAHWNKYTDAVQRSNGGLYLNVAPDGTLSH